MLDQGSGTIVNTANLAALTVGGKYRCAYAASKAGIVSLSKAAAIENAEYNLRVNVICPSHARTPGLEKFLELRPELEDAWITQTPMGRIATPEEVAAVVRWLAGESASYVTGALIPVNGGLYM